MMFNNRFTADNKIHFVPSEWICTDPDEVQFCRVINGHTFEFIQLKNDQMREEVKGGFNALAALDEETIVKDWYEDEININDYDADQLGREIAPYSGILDGVSDFVERNRLIAECIFENNLLCGDYDY